MIRLTYPEDERFFPFIVCFSLISVCLTEGTLINLTSTEVDEIAAQDQITIEEGTFIISSIGASGSGVLTRWYGLQDDNDQDHIEYGYNYDGSQNPLPFDQKTGGVMEPTLYVGDLATVVVDGNEYAEFVLDTNENDGFISLDTFQLFVYDDPYTSPYLTSRSQLNNLGSLVYDMDETVDYSILIEETGSGSGSTDLTVLVSMDTFDSYADDSKVYLFSEFGNAGSLPETHNGLPTGTSLNFGVANGFEEWGFRKSSGIAAVPEASAVLPATLMGLIIIGHLVRKRRLSSLKNLVL